MKTKMIAIAMGMLLSAPIFAQNRDTDMRDDDTQIRTTADRVGEDLELDEDQQTEVYSATERMYQAQREDVDGENREQIQQDYDNAMRETLDEDQYNSYMESDARRTMMQPRDNAIDRELIEEQPRMEQENDLRNNRRK